MKSTPKPRNPIAKAVRRIRPQVVAPKRGRGSYSRKRIGKA
jgi:hypothetical protein